MLMDISTCAYCRIASAAAEMQERALNSLATGQAEPQKGEKAGKPKTQSRTNQGSSENALMQQQLQELTQQLRSEVEVCTATIQATSTDCSCIHARM